ncbi:DUF4974 domain-containing protein [Pedobacter sp. BS3]|uniref:FecR family protein n=1 Tax=Pedobacter sp. BS3 TaxID=2567937 RepID=UPI0011EBC1FD|nr:FecR family protein [Pedobacter sp. BS3]TZF83275.1 DUF4974 domain-containing protein [Pedobacter sp. BS3]
MAGTQITAELIQKYLDGNCTLEEKASVIVWYNSFDKEEDILGALKAGEKERLKQLMLNRINARIDETRQKNIGKPKVRNLTYWISGVAAALLIALGVTLYQYNQPAITNNQHIKEARLLVLENMGTTMYQRKLEDGTHIWLSPGARIELPEHFAANTREVSMTGKVFFEVAKNPKRPFLIYAGGVTTRVVGTSFLVKAEKGKDTEVSVVTGKVAVAVSDKTSENVFLLPQQKAVFSASKKSLAKEEVPAKSEVQMWKKPKLSFDNASIKEVTDVLARNFNVTIHSNNAISTCVLKADFSDQNLASILDMLCKSIDASYEIKDDTITITGKGCN